MKVVLQLVKESSVTIENKEISRIGNGLLLLVSFTHGDNLETMHKVIDKIVSLRIFADDSNKTNLPFDKENHEILCVSQFTLYADCSHGRRPSFTSCMDKEEARLLYRQTCDYIKSLGINVKEGIFQADMKVSLVNDGPFTLIIDSGDLK